MIETKEEFEEICKQVELTVKENWDDVQYLRGGDVKESIEGQYYTTFEYWHHNKKFNIHINNSAISVYQDSLTENKRIFKCGISKDWNTVLAEFLKTI